MTVRYRIEFSKPDGEQFTIEAGEDEFLLAAARRCRHHLPSLCEQGWDLACAVRVLDGDWDNSAARRYFEQDQEAGFMLPCTARARSDMRVQTHQTGAMRENRDRHGLPAPRGT